MPESIRELYDAICAEVAIQKLTPALEHYAVGWVLFDIFERAEHEEARLGTSLSSAEFDKLALEITPGRIKRGVDEAQDEFGKAAASFMDHEMQNRIEDGINRSVVSEVKSVVSQVSIIKSQIDASINSPKAFFINVAAGLIGAAGFAVILIVASIIWDRDPSPIALAKKALHSPPSADRSEAQITDLPAAPPPSPAPPK
jgi:hypothetical protein